MQNEAMVRKDIENLKLKLNELIIKYPNEMVEQYNLGMEKGLRHANPSDKTLKITKDLMDNQELITAMVRELKEDFKEFRERNNKDHCEIIEHQKHTNGAMGELKRSQIILRTVLATVFIIMAVLGFMPQRLYDILRGII